MRIPLFASLLILAASAGLAAEADSGRTADSASGPTSYDSDYRSDYGYRSYSGPDAPADPVPLLLEGRMAVGFFDFELGGRIGGETMRFGLPMAFFFDLEGRPYRRAVRVRESEDLEYQYREHRFTFGPGVSVGYPLGNEAMLMAGAGAGVSLGLYRGTNRGAPAAFPIWMEAGMRFRTGPARHIALMYQYFPLPDVASHRVSLVLGLTMLTGGSK